VYEKATGFDEPAWVVIVTETVRGAPSAGKVISHVVCVEHLVPAPSPPTTACTCPLGLNKLLPVTVTTWPAPPASGASELIAGAPGGTVVEGGADVLGGAAVLGGVVLR
jgi:hypothetical protein